MESVKARLRAMDKAELESVILELSRRLLELEDPSVSMTSQQRATSTTFVRGASTLDGWCTKSNQTTASALDALAASMAPVQAVNVTHHIADEVFARYAVDEEAQSRFTESKRLRENPKARQRVLDMFVQRIKSRQGQSVLALIRGGESQLVNNSKIFVQCVREIETR
jgi:hypothetical protein